MIRSFHTRTWLALVTGSLLLAIGLFLFLRGQAALAEANDFAKKVRTSNEQVNALAKSSADYRELIRRTGWRPGITLRRESIDMSTTFAGSEMARINEIFAVSYTGLGYFSLNSFKLEQMRPGAAGTMAVKVGMRGDNILVLETK